jgi:hypothetical protein
MYISNIMPLYCSIPIYLNYSPLFTCWLQNKWGEKMCSYSKVMAYFTVFKCANWFLWALWLHCHLVFGNEIARLFSLFHVYWFSSKQLLKYVEIFNYTCGLSLNSNACSIYFEALLSCVNTVFLMNWLFLSLWKFFISGKIVFVWVTLFNLRLIYSSQ